MLSKLYKNICCRNTISNQNIVRSISSNAIFEPELHLYPWKSFITNKEINVSRITLSQLQLDANVNASNFNNTSNVRDYLNLDFAFCEPIRLLSDEAIDIIHHELNQPKILNNCYYYNINNPDQFIIRGLHKYSPFMEQLMNSKELTQLLSFIVGIELDVYPMQFERGTIVLQQYPNNTENIFTWHYDSQPFTLLIMISDPVYNSNFDVSCGGTLYQDGCNNIHEIVYPESGYGSIMQSSKVYHCSNYSKNYLRAMFTTSYRKKNKLNWGNVKVASQYTPFKPLLADFIKGKFSDLESEMDAIMKEYIHVCDEHTFDQMKDDTDYNHLLLQIDDIRKQIDTITDSIQYLQTQQHNQRIPQQLIPEKPLLSRKKT
eukprot:12790_1